jgi:hypothetical protein
VPVQHGLVLAGVQDDYKPIWNRHYNSTEALRGYVSPLTRLLWPIGARTADQVEVERHGRLRPHRRPRPLPVRADL